MAEKITFYFVERLLSMPKVTTSYGKAGSMDQAFAYNSIASSYR